VKVFEEAGQWFKIEFQDLHWGRRVGHVLREAHVSIEPRPKAALRPYDSH
jgi:hypothetical protein